MDPNYLVIGALAILGFVLYQRRGRKAGPLIGPSAPQRQAGLIETFNQIGLPAADRILAEQFGIEEALSHAAKVGRVAERLQAQHGAKPEPPKS